MAEPLSNEVKQEMIDQIIDCFDFKKVEKAMTTLDWKWATLDRVPDIYELKAEARKRLRKALVAGRSVTGGFAAEYSSDGVLSLTFQLADWSVWAEGGKVICG